MMQLDYFGSLPVLRAAAEQGAAPDFVALLLQWGPGGLMLALILSGFLVPKSMIDSIKADREAWRMAFEKEREAHQVTRSSLQLAQSQAGLALETSKTQVAIFERMGHVPKDREYQR